MTVPIIGVAEFAEVPESCKMYLCGWQQESARVYSPHNPYVLLYNYGEGHDGEFSRLKEAYEHHSPNPAWFELSALRRWFVLHDFVRRNGIETFWHFDWDVLIFTDLTQERFISSTPPLGHYFCRHAADLSDWIAFLIRVYEDRSLLKRVVQAREAGVLSSISDMHLSRWVYGFTDPLSCVLENAVFCNNLYTGQNDCVLDAIGKKLTWREGQPYMTQSKTQREIRLKTLHCWGPHKYKMAEYVETAFISKGQDVRFKTVKWPGAPIPQHTTVHKGTQATTGTLPPMAVLTATTGTSAIQVV